MNDTNLKLAIGGSMGVVESMIGGNLLENLKFMKQNGTKYNNAVKILYQRNGLYGLMYSGYFPAGLVQSLCKGMPFFYTSFTVKEYMIKKKYDSNTIALASGAAGGLSQGLFMGPTQRVRVLLVMTKDMTLSGILKQEKLNIFKGTPLLSVRRALDWSLRSFIMNKLNIDNSNSNILLSSFAGGLMAVFTLPLDVLITRIQTSNTNISLVTLVKTMIKNEGIKSLANGLVMRSLYSGWHTMWVAGIGTIVYNKFKNNDLQKL